MLIGTFLDPSKDAETLKPEAASKRPEFKRDGQSAAEQIANNKEDEKDQASQSE